MENIKENVTIILIIILLLYILYIQFISLPSYLTKNDASKSYLSINDASTSYLTNNDASAIFKKISDKFDQAFASYLTKNDASSSYLTKNDASTTYLPKINPMVEGSIKIHDPKSSEISGLNFYQTIEADGSNLNLYSSYDGNAKIVLQLNGDPRIIVGSNRAIKNAPTRTF